MRAPKHTHTFSRTPEVWRLVWTSVNCPIVTLTWCTSFLRLLQFSDTFLGSFSFGLTSTSHSPACCANSRPGRMRVNVRVCVSVCVYVWTFAMVRVYDGGRRGGRAARTRACFCDVGANMGREAGGRECTGLFISCGTLNKGARLYGLRQRMYGISASWYTFSICNTLQHTATHCNTLQHTATHCNTLQHTATPLDIHSLYLYIKRSKGTLHEGERR